MKNRYLTIIALLLIVVAAMAQDCTLRFRDGKFRIAQFTDMHLGSRGSDVEANFQLVNKVVAEEQPNLIVLTGDNVTDADDIPSLKALWGRLIGVLESTNVPYAIVMGNHDAEATDGFGADSLEVLLTNIAPHCLNYPSTAVCFGHGNKALPIFGCNGKPQSLVYVIDSNDYPADPKVKEYSDYAWIHPDQIEWYKSESNRYTHLNSGKPLPAVAYYHICVPEFNDVVKDENRYGFYLERCCPSDINTGFFSAAFLQGDIMGMFVGHDHTNDFIGIRSGIALGYGRQSGVAGMDENTPRGSRIVELYEGQRMFNTWIRTYADRTPTYYYPLGCSSEVEENLLPAADVKTAGQGVNYTYYEGTGKSLGVVLTKKNLKKEGFMSNFDITKAPVADHFGYAFDTYFLAEEDGAYCFRLLSDDGATLTIDGKLIIDNDGSHSSNWKQGYIGLAKGLHHVQVKYFEDYMGQKLNITYATVKTPEQAIPDRLLFRK